MVLLTIIFATFSLMVAGAASAGPGGMMNGDWAGGMREYGGSSWLILCVVVAVAVVAWILYQKRK